MDDARRTDFTLQRDPAQAREARRHVARACTGLARDVVEIAQLLTTELVTNAIEHGTGEIRLGITRSDTDLRVDVSDAAPGRPRATEAAPHQTRGRGLLLVEAMAAAWGVEPPIGQPKTVWFRLRVGAPVVSGLR